MLLDIIIPHYNEPWYIVKPFFDILDSQKGIDFDDFTVHLVHNGYVDFDSKKLRKDYTNLAIAEYHMDKPGVSRARNYGLERSTADWVCFCDCDDCYTSIFSLMMIFHALKDKNSDNFDLLWGSFYMYGCGPMIKSDKFSHVFIHNKYYRRSFLMEHNIRFCEDLHMSEDSAFNTIVKLEIGPHRIGQIDYPEPLYAWCRRPGSITMDESKWIYNTEGHFERNLYVLNEYIKRNIPDKNLMVARTITDAYAMLNKTGYYGDSTNLRKRIAEFYLANKKDFESVSAQNFLQVLNASNRDACRNEQEIEHGLTFNEWFNKLIDEYKGDN